MGSEEGAFWSRGDKAWRWDQAWCMCESLHWLMGEGYWGDWKARLTSLWVMKEIVLIRLD